LKIHELRPEDIEPNGDRYVVEVIDIDEKIELGRILVVTQQPKMDPRDPQADPTLEQRGVMVAVVVRAGNGHLLGLPDHKLAVLQRNPHPNTSGYEEIMVAPADVPMFFEPGTVVFVDHNAKGRALKILGRECRIVNQIDILAALPSMKLRRSDDGGWERAE
jgi:co-chaperonin GroES (HSP10)